uniref:Uncharacterized protein n=1 Tax=Globisporangium ultimum (strain ATCC 200006 / CBS 805.95 / DAOM BR144) TaxID=431595 RepID=K3WXF6_GLOUD
KTSNKRSSQLLGLFVQLVCGQRRVNTKKICALEQQRQGRLRARKSIIAILRRNELLEPHVLDHQSLASLIATQSLPSNSPAAVASIPSSDRPD